MLLLVFAVGGAALYTASRFVAGAGGAAGIPDRPLRIQTVTRAGLSCPTDAAFSPDGKRFVVLGTTGTVGTCAMLAPPREPIPQAAAIFDTATGATQRVISLDAALGMPTLAALRQRVAWVSYSGLGWSPDGSTLAVVYTMFQRNANFTPASVLASGLLVLDTRTWAAHVLRGDSGFFGAPGNGSASYPIWNLAQGTENPAYTPAPGLAYAWGYGNAPAPVAPLPASLPRLPITAGPRYPVGNPVGGATFTTWQAGLILGANIAGQGYERAAFETTYVSWSPDSMRVTLLTGHLALPSAARHDVHTPGAFPVVPSRDAALDTLLQQLDPNSAALVAWNRGGSLLASIPCAAPQHETLDVRDTETGQLVGTAALGLPAHDSGCQGVTSGTGAGNVLSGAYPSRAFSLLWSPDGRRILTDDRAASILTLWPITG